MISFDLSARDFAAVHKIATRALPLFREAGSPHTQLDIHMDVAATHANGCPLRLEDLAAADDFNFAHDVFGISAHLDRDTGRLDGRFLPRFVAPVAAADPI